MALFGIVLLLLVPATVLVRIIARHNNILHESNTQTGGACSFTETAETYIYEHFSYSNMTCSCPICQLAIVSPSTYTIVVLCRMSAMSRNNKIKQRQKQNVANELVM